MYTTFNKLKTGDRFKFEGTNYRKSSPRTAVHAMGYLVDFNPTDEVFIGEA